LYTTANIIYVPNNIDFSVVQRHIFLVWWRLFIFFGFVWAKPEQAASTTGGIWEPSVRKQSWLLSFLHLFEGYSNLQGSEISLWLQCRFSFPSWKTRVEPSLCPELIWLFQYLHRHPAEFCVL